MRLKNSSGFGGVRQASRGALSLLLAVAVFLGVASSALGQNKDKKNKKKDNTPAADSTNPLIPMSDEQQIDYMISEMLGAWQIGDIEKLHKDYADDVSVVSGAWAPPVFGWTSYLALYQQQRARMQQVRMDRFNSYIKVNGVNAWACYQWDFAATVDGQPMTAQGQTTLVMEKRNNHWVIAHNHTSLVQVAPVGTPTGTPAPSTPTPGTPTPTQETPVKPPAR
jgi:ketosteroid isomerase-like protein